MSEINIPPFEPEFNRPEYGDFHAVFTIQMGELIQDGLIDFSDGTWDTMLNGKEIQWYNEAQKKRFWDKFEQFYFYREIGELPYLRWKGNLLAKIAMLMPKYCLLYKALEKGVNPLQEYDDYGKSRNIYSDFPQTMLSGNEDYASTGNDNQYERIREGNFVEKMNAVMDDFDDLDYSLIKKLDTHFYCVLTSNMNGI